MKNIYVVMFCVLFSAAVFAQPVTCERRHEIKTSKGKLIREVCTPSNPLDEVQNVWSLEGRRLVTGRHPITVEDRNDATSLFVLQGAKNSITGCPNQVFLIDLTGTAPRVFSFGVKNACSEYHWAKWSNKKRSVIALKFNVQFTYVNGKLIPPEDTDGDKFGTPLGYEAPTPATPPTPFVQELVLPKN